MTMAPDPGVSRYIQAVQGYPKLSREEELALARRYQESHDPAAAEQLVRAHLRYVVAIALKYRRYGLPLSELIAEGNFGVVHALRKFEPERGNRFVTYAAYWIRAYVLNYVIRSWSLVGVGSGALRSKMFFKLRRERVRITNLVGEGSHADEMLARKFNLPAAEITAMVRRLEARDVSLDVRPFDDSRTTLVDTLVAPDRSQEETVATGELETQMRSTVRAAVEGLDARERYIVERRLMADPEDELSLAEIGRRLGVSRERARQLEARAKKKLKTRIREIAKGSGDDWLPLETAA
jgi:RNA polymerase sigma-32 factor